MAARLASIVCAICVGILGPSAPALAQTPEPSGALYDVPLPGGLPAALAAIGDRVAADRSQFLHEFIRRTYNSPIDPRNDPRAAAVNALAEAIERGRRGPAGSTETLPLPLPPATWTSVVFAGRETPDTLVAAILRSRHASLLYFGLLGLDDATRAWLATEPALIADLAADRAPAFAIAAPGLRIASRPPDPGTPEPPGPAVQLPGGDAALSAWETLVGRPAREPAAFIRAVVSRDRGRLAYFISVLADIAPERLRVALHLEADAGERRAALQRFYAVCNAVAPAWNIDTQTFWRPTLDPGLLLTELRFDADGASRPRATTAFWNAVFADRPPKADERIATDGEPSDPLWLAEQVFAAKRSDPRPRYEAVLFASRMAWPLTRANIRDAAEAVRAVVAFPALALTLERAGVVDAEAYADAARRASRLSTLAGADGERSVASFQGLVALLSRSATRGSLSRGTLTAAVRSLSQVDTDANGEYQGALVRWLDSFFAARPAARTPPDYQDAGNDPIEDAWIGLLSGAVGEPPVVEWEGTRYRVDVRQGEWVRLRRLLGNHSRPYLSSAQAVAAIADALRDVRSGDDLRQQAAAFAKVVEPLSPSALASDDVDERQQAVAAMDRAARSGDTGAGPRLARQLSRLADALLSRGVLELVYATALGQPDQSGVPLVADDIARRHELGIQRVGTRTAMPWQPPITGSELLRGWHVSGGLLGLDLSLVELSPVRLSARPITKPTLSDADRRELTKTWPLVAPGAATDSERDAIAGLLALGRERVAAIAGAGDAGRLADEIRMSETRRGLFRWAAVQTPGRTPAFPSVLELLWMGLEGRRLDGRFDAWGAAAGMRIGCYCLQVVDPRPLESLASRPRTGFLLSAFPDLSLRLAELMQELHMPAILLGPVLAAATVDIADRVPSRDEGDRRALAELVQALRIERLEEYLALLTTDGPLVPVLRD